MSTLARTLSLVLDNILDKLLGPLAASAQNSSLIATMFLYDADGVTEAAVDLHLEDEDGNVLAGRTAVRGAQYSATLDADESFVSANPTDIASDGIESSVITIQVMRLVGGVYLPVVNLPAENIVIAVTGPGNTITQPVLPTNASGITTGSFVSTEAAATKTVSVTVFGLALTTTATVTTDSGYSPPPPGDPDYETGFESGAFANDGVFVWGATTGDVVVNNVAAYAGTYSAAFTFGPNAPGSDDSAQKNFALGQDYPIAAVEFYLFVPSNYVHRNEGFNKFIRLWKNDYNNDAKMGASLSYNADGSNFFFEYNRRSWSTGAVGQGLGPSVAFIRAADLNAWMRVRMRFTPVTAENADDGVLELWKGDTKLINFTGVDQGWESGGNVFRSGYLLGWSNSGFADATTLRIDDLKFYATDPGWT